MFRRVLIANRGEIACRVIRTARRQARSKLPRMGIETVGVFSQADRGSLHAESLDIPILIGGNTPGESYLRQELIANTAVKTKAEAVHPGFGFLSENSKFVGLLEKKGVTFVGPPRSAIELMGSKKESKIAMESAKVRVVPGYHGEKQEVEL